MDKYDLRARGVANNSRQIYSLGEKYAIGKVKNTTGFCGSEKQGNESENEINSCEGTKPLATEMKPLNYLHVSSGECTKENAHDCGSLSSVISTSTSLTQTKELCGGESHGVISCCSGLAVDGNMKDAEVPKYSNDGIDSRRNISMNCDVSAETRQLQKEKELVTRTDVHCLSVGEDGKQLKTESSSSNSMHIILPTSSNDSYQEASVDGKSCKYGKTSDMVTSTSADKKHSHEECAIRSSLLGRALDIVENAEATDCDKVLGVIADGNSINVKKTDVLKSNLYKKKSAELSDQGNEDSCYEVDDALEVACRVAKEVEKDVGTYKEVSGSSSTIEEKNSESVNQSSVDSVYPTRKDLLTEAVCRVQSCDEQVKCVTYCSTNVEDSKTSKKGEQLFVEVDEPSVDVGSKVIHKSSYITTKPEDVSCNGQTTDVSGIDLNEDFLGTEMDYPMQSGKGMESLHSGHLSKPIPVVATSGISICFPIYQSEGKTSGWRGSAITSAFRPTPFSKSLENKAFFSKNDNDSSKHSDIKGFDLNIVASGVDYDVEFHSNKYISAPSSLPCKASSVDVCSTNVGRFDFDLNYASENGHLSPQASPSKPYARDFDLNDNPVSKDPCNGAHQSLRNKASHDSALFFQGKARQSDPSQVCPMYLQDLSSVRSLSHSHARPYQVAAPSMLPPAEQMQRMVPVHHNMTYQPPSHAFHYNHGLLFHPNNHQSSALYSPGVLPYMTDPRGANFIPQNDGSPCAPHMMEVPGGHSPSDLVIMRPNFDRNSGTNSMGNGSRGASTRQQYIPISTSLMEEQMRSFQHSVPPHTLKRMEPDGGWDSHQLGHRQVNPWR